MAGFSRRSVGWAVACAAAMALSGGAAAEVTRSGLQLVASRRMTRTVFEYTYRVQADNSGIVAVHASGAFTSSSPYTTIVDGSVDFGVLPALGSGASTDTLTIRHDRQYPFDPSALVMQVTSDAAVGFSLETSNGGSAEVGAAGGTVAATASSGYGYALRVPPGALGTAATIELTPIAEVTGFALGSAVVGGVQLSPDGQSFAQPVSITITPPSGVPLPATLVAFQLAGGEVAPLGSFASGGAFTVEVTHFSDIVLVDPTDAAVASATSVYLKLLGDFNQWVDAFVSGDEAYFADPSHPRPPTCATSTSLANQAIGLCKMQEVLNLGTCDDLFSRLVSAMHRMVDGPGGANAVCEASGGDDSLFLQCAETLEGLFDFSSNFESLYGGDSLALKSCGAKSVIGSPSPVNLTVGQSLIIRFDVLGFSFDVLVRTLGYDLFTDPGAVTMTVLDNNRVNVTCNAIGTATVSAYDVQSLTAHVFLRDEVPVVCSKEPEPPDVVLEPTEAVVIGSEPATFTLLVNGGPVPLGDTVEWFGPYVDPQYPGGVFDLAHGVSQATVSRAPGSLWTGRAILSACVTEPGHFPQCPAATFYVVPDIRGRWRGTGAFQATGCQDPEDDGVYLIPDWSISFTQALVPGTRESTIAGAFSGSGIGDRVFGPLIGIMGEHGSIVGDAAYAGSQGSGSATFTGTPGPLEVRLDFAFHDTAGDTCSGTGTVTFTP